MIEIRKLSKYYGRKRALGPISATIDKGEVVGLLGLNGAGKTTTLRVLACDLLPSSGSVKVDGVDVVEQPDAVRRRIGYLPDRPPLYDEMRVEPYLEFAHALRGGDPERRRRRIDQVAERLGLGDVLSAPLFSLSHGYRQRVGIAQAIVHEPELVVLDEPISGLDPVQIVEMRSLVRSLGDEHTVIVSSHILSEVSETCDRLLVMRQGEIVAEGSERELSAQRQEGARVRLSLAIEEARRPQAMQVLLAVSGVDEVQSIDALEPGAAVQSFEVSAGGDVRAALASALVAAQLPLLSLTKTDGELEDVFIRLAGARPTGSASTAGESVGSQPTPGASGAGQEGV